MMCYFPGIWNYDPDCLTAATNISFTTTTKSGTWIMLRGRNQIGKYGRLSNENDADDVTGGDYAMKSCQISVHPPSRIGQRGKSSSNHVVDNLSRTIELVESVMRLSSRDKDHDQPSRIDLITNTMNDLIGNMLDAVPLLVDAHSVERVFQASHDTIDLTPRGIAGIKADILPVVVMRELLGTYKVVFDSTRCPNFDIFIERYADAMLGPEC